MLEQEEETEDTSQNSLCWQSVGYNFILFTGHDLLAVDKAFKMVTISLSYKCKYGFREYLGFKWQSLFCVHSIRKVDGSC